MALVHNFVAQCGHRDLNGSMWFASIGKSLAIAFKFYTAQFEYFWTFLLLGYVLPEMMSALGLNDVGLVMQLITVLLHF